MGNLSKAIQIIEQQEKKQNQINKITKKKKQLLNEKQINLIDNTLQELINNKRKKYEETTTNNITKQYEKQIISIHNKAITLYQEIQNIKKEITTQNPSIEITERYNYDNTYWDELPENMQELSDKEFIQCNAKNNPKIEKLEEEIKEYITNLKLGLETPEKIKEFTEKINQLQL